VARRHVALDRDVAMRTLRLTYAIYGVRIPSMDKTTLYLTPELRLRLRAAARRSGRRQADVIRSALDAYLDEAKANRPRSIGAGADDAVDAADAEAWLRQRWRSR
jgi:hypothetical protein